MEDEIESKKLQIIKDKTSFIEQQLNDLTYKEAKQILKGILIDMRESSIVTFEKK